MDRWLNSELNILANQLNRIALADRHTCDFTLKALRDALTEVITEIPVYRTYVTGDEVSPTDRLHISKAVNGAKARSTSTDSTVYDFIREVLLTSRAEGRPEAYQHAVIHFAMRFQQYTGALMAKGLEDTCFYRYNRLISLNEVGGDPQRFGVSPQEFHLKIQARARVWPHEMVATSTHDSKRSEDVRARINMLSEIPLAWNHQLRIWRKLNRKKKAIIAGAEAPDPNDEYLLYQTLVGAWPYGTANGSPTPDFVDRICNYMLKGMREAKEKTSWSRHKVVAFARVHKSGEVIVAVPRLCATLLKGEPRLPSGGDLGKTQESVFRTGRQRCFAMCSRETSWRQRLTKVVPCSPQRSCLMSFPWPC